MVQEQRKQVEGVVVSDKMEKSIVVKVERSWRHPLYGKVVKTAKKYHAHDENNEAREGDRVRLLESRPISKLKKWVLLEIVERPERA
jgi:small subunit ribosomal protein S17